MRLIKFRWFNQDTKKIELLNNWSFKDWVLDIGTPIMQFTGLFDQNWKEIYEGDICIIQDDDEWFAQNYDEEKDEYIDIEKCVMQWRKDGAGFYPKCDTIDNSEGWYWEQLNFEVIWNIYENPDLLSK